MVEGSALGRAELYGSPPRQSYDAGDHGVAPRAPPRGAAVLEDRGIPARCWVMGAAPWGPQP